MPILNRLLNIISTLVCGLVFLFCLAFIVQAADNQWQILDGRSVWLVTLFLAVALLGAAKGMDIFMDKRNAALVVNGYANGYADPIDETDAAQTEKA